MKQEVMPLAPNPPTFQDLLNRFVQQELSEYIKFCNDKEICRIDNAPREARSEVEEAPDPPKVAVDLMLDSVADRPSSAKREKVSLRPRKPLKKQRKKERNNQRKKPRTKHTTKSGTCAMKTLFKIPGTKYRVGRMIK